MVLITLILSFWRLLWLRTTPFRRLSKFLEIPVVDGAVFWLFFLSATDWSLWLPPLRSYLTRPWIQLLRDLVLNEIASQHLLWFLWAMRMMLHVSLTEKGWKLLPILVRFLSHSAWWECFSYYLAQKLGYMVDVWDTVWHPPITVHKLAQIICCRWLIHALYCICVTRLQFVALFLNYLFHHFTFYWKICTF